MAAMSARKQLTRGGPDFEIAVKIENVEDHAADGNIKSSEANDVTGDAIRNLVVDCVVKTESNEEAMLERGDAAVEQRGNNAVVKPERVKEKQAVQGEFLHRRGLGRSPTGS